MKKFIISFICGCLFFSASQIAFSNPQISNEIALCVEKGAIEAFSIGFDDWKHKLSLYTKIILFLEKTKLEVDQEIKFDYTNDCSHYYWYSRNCEFYHYSEDNYRKKFYIKFKHKIDSDSKLQVEINKLTNFGDKKQPKSVNAFFNRLKKIIEPSECDRLLKKDNTEEVEEEKKEQERLTKEAEKEKKEKKEKKEQQRLAKEEEEKKTKEASIFTIIIKGVIDHVTRVIFPLIFVLIMIGIFLLYNLGILKKLKNQITHLITFYIGNKKNSLSNISTININSPSISNDAIIVRETTNNTALSYQQYIKIKNAPTTSILTINHFWWAVGGSAIGKSHLDSKPPLPCQDSHYLGSIDRAWGIAISCDGAGSAENSHFGSKFVAEKAAERFSKDIDKIRFEENSSWITSRNRKTKLPTHKEWHDLAKKIFAEILQDLEKYAKEKNIEVKSLACTVIVVIFSPKGLLVTHIGDGRGGYRNKNGEWKSFLTPFKGEEANQTIFITSPYIWKDLDKLESRIITEEVTAFTIMSDGCESHCFQTYMQDNTSSEELRVVDVNKPHEGFFEPLYNNLYEMIANPEISPPEKIKEDWGNFLLSGKGFDTEPDDKTMIIGILKQGTQK